MTELVIVDELYTWLVERGLAQPPDRPPSPTIPSLWLMPRDGGIPAPRKGEDMTVTLVDTGLRAPSHIESWIEETAIEVTTRTRTENGARLLHRALRGLLAGESLGRRGWGPMGRIPVVEWSHQWRPEQPLPSVDRQTYLRRSSFLIQVRLRHLLTG